MQKHFNYSENFIKKLLTNNSDESTKNESTFCELSIYNVLEI